MTRFLKTKTFCLLDGLFTGETLRQFWISKCIQEFVVQEYDFAIELGPRPRNLLIPGLINRIFENKGYFVMHFRKDVIIKFNNKEECEGFFVMTCIQVLFKVCSILLKHYIDIWQIPMCVLDIHCYIYW